MTKIQVEASERSPEIDFDFDTGVFTIRGESYPEDVNVFYGPAITQLKSYLASLSRGAVRFDFELIYFNSSSAKVLMDLFDALDAAAAAGVDVVINWTCSEDDDNLAELGQEFAEDLQHANFNLLKQPT